MSVIRLSRNGTPAWLIASALRRTALVAFATSLLERSGIRADIARDVADVLLPATFSATRRTACTSSLRISRRSTRAR
jgi:hypothetical protein